ncbi:hypothetical protein F5J12DRAFT_335760 [Pisolithus orientalis]|uniref:uncharacterized protein n=1 Tax=Pisolithus orientalis TaxID=936130 RepID=UPI002225217B|nr:uncharacterized protein F5J12DRAFT_335760 [Pisolithus orientalis]KAI5997698.1 hypothetical protein F5J12DRAFT_335760 [Pisolithus orientalis]
MFIAFQGHATSKKTDTVNMCTQILSSTSTYPNPTSGNATNTTKPKSRPRTPTFSTLMRVPNLSMPVLKNKPSLPFGLARRCRSALGTSKRATPECNSRRISSSHFGWRSSESSSSSSTSGYDGYHVPYVPLDPPTPPVSVPPLGTKILERFWPENEPFSMGDADVSHCQRPPLGHTYSASLDRTQGFVFETAVNDWTAGSGSGLGKEIPHRFSMLTPPPSRRVSRIQPLSTSVTATRDLPFSDEFPRRPSVDHRVESELRFPF